MNLDTPAALQQYLERDTEGTEGTEDTRDNELTGSLHLPSETHDFSKTDDVQSEKDPMCSNVGTVIEGAVCRDDATPLASAHGSEQSGTIFDPPTSVGRPKSPSSKKSQWPRSGPYFGIEKYEHPGRLGKQPTSISDPGVDAQDFYKHCEELENPGDALQYYMREPNIGPGAPRTAFQDSQNGLYTPQRFNSSTSRTFTPPAPAFPVATSPAPPAFASPVPLRARPSVEPYTGYQQTSAYNIHHPSSISQSYFHGHDAPPYHPRAGSSQFAPRAEGLPCSDPAASATPADVTRLKTGEHNRIDLFDDTMGLLHKLHETLPRMRMLVTNVQHAGASDVSTNRKVRVDDYSISLEQKEERIEGKAKSATTTFINPLKLFEALLGSLDETEKRYFAELDKLKSDVKSMEKKDAEAKEAWEVERRELAHKLDAERQNTALQRETERRSIDQHWQTINETQRKEYSTVIEEIKASYELSLREQHKAQGLLEAENKRLRQDFAKKATDFRSAAKQMNEQNVSA